MYNIMTIVNTAVWYMGKLLREYIQRVLITEEFFFFSLYSFEITDVN